MQNLSGCSQLIICGHCVIRNIFYERGQARIPAWIRNPHLNTKSPSRNALFLPQWFSNVRDSMIEYWISGWSRYIPSSLPCTARGMVRQGLSWIPCTSLDLTKLQIESHKVAAYKLHRYCGCVQIVVCLLGHCWRCPTMIDATRTSAEMGNAPEVQAS